MYPQRHRRSYFVVHTPDKKLEALQDQKQVESEVGVGFTITVEVPLSATSRESGNVALSRNVVDH